MISKPVLRCDAMHDGAGRAEGGGARRNSPRSISPGLQRTLHEDLCFKCVAFMQAGSLHAAKQPLIGGAVVSTNSSLRVFI